MTKVLLVEDDPDHACLAIKLLEHGGYEVIWKENAKDAIEAYIQNMFSLCLLDIMLPDMSGEVLVQKLKEILKEKTPAILAVTAHIVEGLKDKLLSCGFDGYIAKPFEIQEFIENLKKYIEEA